MLRRPHTFYIYWSGGVDVIEVFWYDIEVTTWSPAGKFFQTEYTMKAMMQRSFAINL